MEVLDDDMAIVPESEEVKRLDKSLRTSLKIVKTAQFLFYILGGLLMFITLRAFWVEASFSIFAFLLGLSYIGVAIFAKFQPKLGLSIGVLIFLSELIFFQGRYNSMIIAPVVLVYAGLGIYQSFKLEKTIKKLEHYGIDTRKYST